MLLLPRGTKPTPRGTFILATTPGVDDNHGSKVSPIVWCSKKIARVVASTLASETYALSGALDQVSWIRLHWNWMIDPSTVWNKPSETLPQLPPAYAVVDCKSLYDLLQKTTVPQCSEYRTLLEALVIKDRLREGIIIKWVHSAAQMADSLTKEMDTSILRIGMASVSSGMWMRFSNRDRIVDCVRPGCKAPPPLQVTKRAPSVRDVISKITRQLCLQHDAKTRQPPHPCAPYA